MDRQVQLLRIYQCCDNYNRFKRLPKCLKERCVEILENAIFIKNYNLVKNSVDLDNYLNDCYLLKINIDVESSVNKISRNSYVINGLCNYLYMFLFRSTFGYKYEFIKMGHMIKPSQVFKVDFMQNNDNNKKYIDYVHNRMNEKIVYKTTAMYQCRKCKQRKTRYREMQLRCGDEGGTLFIECVVCGYSWKKNS